MTARRLRKSSSQAFSPTTRRGLLLLGLTALAACATPPPTPTPTLAPTLAPPPTPVRPPQPIGPHTDPPNFDLLEPILAASAGRDGVTIRVRSMGCTTKTDFAFYVERRTAGSTLAFARKRVDVCKSRYAPPLNLTFTYAELGLDPTRPIFLLNPLGGP
jgi:hypothetical protein